MAGMGLGAFVPDSQKYHPTYPHLFVPAWHPHAPAHGPCSSCIAHADADSFSGSSCSLKKHVEMFLEIIGTIDPSSTMVSYVSTFHGDLAFCCYFSHVSPILECLPFRFSPLHRGPGFQLTAMTACLTVYTHSCPPKSLHDDRRTGWQKLGWQGENEKNLQHLHV